MYPNMFRRVLNITKKLNNQINAKNVGVIGPILPVQQLLPCLVYQCIRDCSNIKIDELKYPKDPIRRKNAIDLNAQEKIDKMIEEDPEKEKLRKIIELEICVRREGGERVPTNLRPRDWLELLRITGRTSRRKYLEYLFVIEKQNEKDKQIKAEKNKMLEETKYLLDQPHFLQTDAIRYGVGQNSLLRRIVDSTMNHYWTWNSLKSIMFGNKIIFDCSYEKYMNQQEIKSCAKQIMESYAVNRQHNSPFEVILCNVNFNGYLIERLHRFIPTLFDDDFPFTLTSKSYLNLFDKSKLVYLSSDANHNLEHYDPNSVYIIGAFVDKSAKEPISLSKSKMDNIQVAKLPLDKYVHFGQGSKKDLTLNQVFSIMLDAQEHSWPQALQHIPIRKLYQNRIRNLERKVQKAMYFNKLDSGLTYYEELQHKDKFNYNQEENVSNRIKRERFDKPRESEKLFHSSGPNDYSHEARLKRRNQSNK